MTALLVDIVIASGFVAACFGAALILFGIGCDVQRWWRRRVVERGARRYLDAMPPRCRCALVPSESWGDVDVDWSEFDRRAA